MAIIESTLPNLITKISQKTILFSAVIELTKKCNWNCGHCYLESKSNLEKELTKNEFKDIIIQLKKLNCLNLVFTGGEALLNSDIFEIAGFARENNFGLALLTNGSLISRDNAKELKKLNFSVVQMSLYGANAKTHDYISRTEGAFDSLMCGISYLKEAGLKVNVSSVIMEPNIDEYDGMKLLCQEKLNVNWFFSCVVSPGIYGSKFPLEYKISDESFNKLTEKFLPDKKDKNVIKIEFEKKKMKEFKHRQCGAGINFCFISSYGEVFPCVLMREKADNIKNNSLEDIWKNAPVFKKLRAVKEEDFADCQKCDIYDNCINCLGYSYLENKDIFKPSKENCRMNRLVNDYAKKCIL